MSFPNPNAATVSFLSSGVRARAHGQLGRVGEGEGEGEREGGPARVTPSALCATVAYLTLRFDLLATPGETCQVFWWDRQR